MDELLRDLRTYLTDASRRERAADERTKMICSSVDKLTAQLQALMHVLQDKL